MQFLEKTQTEAYLEFKSKYPEIKISQRLFENYKPFFVVPELKTDVHVAVDSTWKCVVCLNSACSFENQF